MPDALRLERLADGWHVLGPGERHSGPFHTLREAEDLMDAADNARPTPEQLADLARAMAAVMRAAVAGDRRWGPGLHAPQPRETIERMAELVARADRLLPPPAQPQPTQESANG